MPQEVEVGGESGGAAGGQYGWICWTLPLEIEVGGRLCRSRSTLVKRDDLLDGEEQEGIEVEAGGLGR